MNLHALIQHNQFGYSEGLEQSCETPMINGYKMIKATPVRKPNHDEALIAEKKKSRGFNVPQNSVREELGVLMANQS